MNIDIDNYQAGVIFWKSVHPSPFIALNDDFKHQQTLQMNCKPTFLRKDFPIASNFWAYAEHIPYRHCIKDVPQLHIADDSKLSLTFSAYDTVPVLIGDSCHLFEEEDDQWFRVTSIVIFQNHSPT